MYKRLLIFFSLFFSLYSPGSLTLSRSLGVTHRGLAYPKLQLQVTP